MQIVSFSRRVALFLFAICFGWCGCASQPPVHLGSGGMKDELAAHVRFLSQPELKGRKTRSAGARLARRYIEDRFHADGLLPWAQEKSYEVPFGLGQNVVGVLPGSDASLSNEIVLLSAHYDHLGKDGKGRIYPGAADNASGVATLLEAARQLSRADHRPKRTIAFVAFDAEEEMMLGSFAFCCRADVERAKIVAVVNVDMLGRDFLDVVQNTVFVGGTDGRPGLQAQLSQFGTEAGIRVLPFASDLMGPRSDHAAFENRERACLFFTCGTFTGYHKSSDTAEKLNYTNLERSAKIVLETVAALANEDQKPSAGPSGWDREEMKSLDTFISELCRSSAKAAIKTQDAPALLHLKGSVEKALASGTHDQSAREQIFLEAVSTLMPYTGVNRRSLSVALYPAFEHIYLNYHREWLEGQKQLVAANLKHPPGLLRGLAPFDYELYDLRDDDLSVRQTGANTFALHALVNGFRWRTGNMTSIWPFKRPYFDIGPAVGGLDCEGSREELMDYCLLRLRRDHTNTLHALAMKKVLGAIIGAEPQGSYPEWLRARLQQAGYREETEWLLSCLRSSNPELSQAAITAAWGSQDSRVREAACEILLNRQMRADVRLHAMRLVVKHPNRTALLALAEVLPDQSPVLKREYISQFQPNYPLANSTSFCAMRPVLEWQISHLTKTLGQEALENLKKITKKDLGADVQAWEKWVRR